MKLSPASSPKGAGVVAEASKASQGASQGHAKHWSYAVGACLLNMFAGVSIMMVRRLASASGRGSTGGW